MPSAAAKLEKQASTEAVDPIRQAIVVIEHKIRNLEKRKRKIESYRELQKTGKELNSDQLNAVAKFEEVLQTLEFARDLSKQFNGIALDAAKQQKKQARKEAQERAQQEVAKVKEILLVQDVLQNMGQENVREDFLAGKNGAALLTEDDLKFLDDIYGEVSPKHSTEEGLPPFLDQVQQSAEHLLSIVDAKPKEIVGTTYAKLKEIVAAIHASGYFDQNGEEAAEVVTDEVPDAVAPVAQEEIVEEEEYVIEAQTAVPPEATVYAPAVVPVVAAAPVAAPVVAPVVTPVGTVESSYFSTNAPAFVPASRPLNEVISSVSGSFNFLQESELDSPDLSVMLTGGTTAAQPPHQHTGPTPPPNAATPVAPIPSQTFTNQNFAAVTTAPVQPKDPVEQQVLEQTPLPAADDTDDWATGEVSTSGDWNMATDTNQGDWAQQSDDWATMSTSQTDTYTTQGNNRGYGRGRGNRGGNSRGGAPNGYSGGRGAGGGGRGGNYQNGRGGGGYGYRNNADGNNGYYQNGYQQRDNFGGGAGGNSNYKRGGRGGGNAPRGGMERGGPRGGRGGNNPRGGNRGGSGSSYPRGGGNKQ